MVAPSHRVRTAPAATGRAAPTAAQWSVIPIVEACVMMRRHIPGIRRILREAPTVVAVKTICAAPAVTDCSIVLLHSRLDPNVRARSQFSLVGGDGGQTRLIHLAHRAPPEQLSSPA